MMQARFRRNYRDRNQRLECKGKVNVYFICPGHVCSSLPEMENAGDVGDAVRANFFQLC